MKTIGMILVGLFLVACAPALTLEELEDRANLTGDWSQVEKRERAMARRQNRQTLQCPSGYVEYCDGGSGRYRGSSRNQCECVTWRDMKAGLQTDW